MAGLFGRGGKASAVPWFAAGDRERAGVRSRASSAARVFAKRSLIAFLTFLLALGSTPAELWAEGAEGLVQADTAQPAGSPAEGSATEGAATENSAASQAAGATGVEGAAENEGAATGSASAGSPASGSGAQGASSGAQDGSAKGDGSSSVAGSSASGAAAVGKHIKGVAESGPKSAERAASGAAAGTDSLDAVVRELSDYRLSLTYGVDTNVNDVLEAKIRSLGHDDVTVTTSAASFSLTNPKARGGVSTALDATNGDVTYFFVNPADVGFQSLDSLRQVSITFILSRGDERVSFTPGRATALPWDDAKVDGLLSAQAGKLEPVFADGETASSVASDFTLPYKVAGASWSEVSWASSNTAVISVSGYGFSDYAAKVSRPSRDTEVTLTATVGVVTAGGPAKTVTREYRVTVKGKDATAERDELQRKIDAAFTPASITELGTGAAVDLSSVTGDLQLPTTRKLGIDGGKDGYKVVYSASAAAPGLEVNGYAARAVRPLPGVAAQPVDLVLTVTSKKNPDVTASKTVRVTVAPLAGADIDAEVSLLREAKAGFAAAILAGQDASSVTGDLDTVTKAYLKDGKLAWARTADEADAVSGGIVPVELPGAGESAGYRLFKSSDPSVISHENLLVKTPEYNTEVTVSARLASASYARYAALYGSDATWGAKLSELAGADVSATVTVRGSTGKDDPDAARTLTVTAKVTGASEPAADGSASAETWAPPTELTYKKSDHATAWDAFTKLMAANGLAYSTDGGEPFSVTSPDGKRTLAMEGSGSVWSYWSFYLNGEPASTYASGHELADGDEIELVYLVDGKRPVEKPEGEQVGATVEVVGQDANGAVQRWAAPTKITLKEGSTAADFSEALFKQAGIGADIQQTQYGWYLSSLTSPFDAGLTLGYDAVTGKYWCLYVNGKASDVGADGVVLKAGDTVSWVYTTYGAPMPDPGDITIDPTAPRPDYEADHPEFAGSTAGGNVVGAPTPVTGAELSWTFDYKADGTGLSDPLIVNGDLYVASGSTLKIIDRATGKVKRSAPIGSTVGYFCRPVYTDGVVVVPREDGSLAAFTADTLTCVWATAPLGGAAGHPNSRYQALSSLTVANGRVLAGFTMVGKVGDASSVGVRGVLVSVDVASGKVVWTKATDSADTSKPAGYYWAGAAASGTDILIGDESGAVSLLDGASGEVLSSVDLGAGPVRAGIIAVPGDSGAFLVVARDGGVLVKLRRTGDGLKEEGRVTFAAESSSTPAISAGKAFVGGVDAQGYGTLSVIDLATMRVERTVRGGTGKAQGAPLVSVTGGRTLVYFTCNGMPGGVWVYQVGDDAARRLYVPDASHSQYSTSTVIADAQGNLYYSNDSGTLFALKAGKAPVPDPAPAPAPAPTPTPKPGPKDSAPNPTSHDKPGSLASRLSAGLRQMSRGGKGGAAAGSSAGKKASASADESTGGTVTATGEAEASTSSSASEDADTASTAATDLPSSSRDLTLAWVLGGVGVAGLAACGIWWLVAGRRRRGDAA